MNANDNNFLASRFRGFYPVVMDIETAGLNPCTDAMLEIAAVTLSMNEKGWLKTKDTLHFHLKPFCGSILRSRSMKLNKIDPTHPFRQAVDESIALRKIFRRIDRCVRSNRCKKAILVAHNAAFDHGFLMAAIKRSKLIRHPFHTFSTFDTATLSALLLGQTILSKACFAAEIFFDSREAHSALYDTHRTAELFCELVNRWKKMGGWPVRLSSSSNKPQNL